MDWCHTFLHTSWIHQIQSFKCFFSNYYVLFKSDGCNDPTVGSASWLQTENEGGIIPHFIKTPEPQQATFNLLIFEGI